MTNVLFGTYVQSMFRTELDRESLAGEIRAAMARRRITTKSLAAATDIPVSTLNRKINGERSLTVEELVKVAIALDIDPVELLGSAA